MFLPLKLFIQETDQKLNLDRLYKYVKEEQLLQIC